MRALDLSDYMAEETQAEEAMLLLDIQTKQADEFEQAQFCANNWRD